MKSNRPSKDSNTIHNVDSLGFTSPRNTSENSDYSVAFKSLTKNSGDDAYLDEARNLTMMNESSFHPSSELQSDIAFDCLANFNPFEDDLAPSLTMMKGPAIRIQSVDFREDYSQPNPREVASCHHPDFDGALDHREQELRYPATSPTVDISSKTISMNELYNYPPMTDSRNENSDIHRLSELSSSQGNPLDDARSAVLKNSAFSQSSVEHVKSKSGCDTAVPLGKHSFGNEQCDLHESNVKRKTDNCDLTRLSHIKELFSPISLAPDSSDSSKLQMNETDTYYTPKIPPGEINVKVPEKIVDTHPIKLHARIASEEPGSGERVCEKVPPAIEVTTQKMEPTEDNLVRNLTLPIEIRRNMPQSTPKGPPKMWTRTVDTQRRSAATFIDEPSHVINFSRNTNNPSSNFRSSEQNLSLPMEVRRNYQESYELPYSFTARQHTGNLSLPVKFRQNSPSRSQKMYHHDARPYKSKLSLPIDIRRISSDSDEKLNRADTHQHSKKSSLQMIVSRGPLGLNGNSHCGSTQEPMNHLSLPIDIRRSPPESNEKTTLVDARQHKNHLSLPIEKRRNQFQAPSEELVRLPVDDPRHPSDTSSEYKFVKSRISESVDRGTRRTSSAYVPRHHLMYSAANNALYNNWQQELQTSSPEDVSSVPSVRSNVNYQQQVRSFVDPCATSTPSINVASKMRKSFAPTWCEIGLQSPQTILNGRPLNPFDDASTLLLRRPGSSPRRIGGSKNMKRSLTDYPEMRKKYAPDTLLGCDEHLFNGPRTCNVPTNRLGNNVSGGWGLGYYWHNTHPVQLLNLSRILIMLPILMYLAVAIAQSADWRFNRYRFSSESRSTTMLSLTGIQRSVQTVQDDDLSIVQELPVSYHRILKPNGDLGETCNKVDRTKRAISLLKQSSSLDFARINYDRNYRVAVFDVFYGPTYRDVDCRAVSVFRNAGIVLLVIFAFVFILLLIEWVLVTLHCVSRTLRQEAEAAFAHVMDHGLRPNATGNSPPYLQTVERRSETYHESSRLFHFVRTLWTRLKNKCRETCYIDASIYLKMVDVCWWRPTTRIREWFGARPEMQGVPLHVFISVIDGPTTIIDILTILSLLSGLVFWTRATDIPACLDLMTEVKTCSKGSAFNMSCLFLSLLVLNCLSHMFSGSILKTIYRFQRH